MNAGRKMTAREARCAAVRALRDLHAYGRINGHAFATLAMIAGLENLPLPFFVGPRRREHVPAFADAGPEYQL